MKTVAIIGAAGYVGGELLRLLIRHPEVKLKYVFSESHEGEEVTKVHPDLIGETGLTFVKSVNTDVNVVFLCKGHGQSKSILKKNLFNRDTVIIDLSQEHRIQSTGHDFIYGLPEWNKEFISDSTRIANPGCFATGIQLGLLPLISEYPDEQDIVIQGITGSTGAGFSPASTSHFSWRNNNLSVYKAFTHQHMAEVLQSFRTINADFNANISFIPVRGNFPRGIFLNFVMNSTLHIDELYDLYQEYYTKECFVHVTKEDLSLKQVTNTNKCLIQLIKNGNKLLIVTILDNLLKGAAGQAIQNMNIALGMNEELGLDLKAVSY